MDCFSEVVATAWMTVRAKFIPSLKINEVATAEESLFLCRNNLMQKIKEYEGTVSVLEKEALKCKQQKDIPSTRSKLQERKRYLVRIDKCKNGLTIIEKQLDTLQSNELDKVLLNTLKVSNNVLKKSVVKVNADEVETMMNELEDRINESSEVTQILGTPMMNNEMFSITEDEELELELEQDLMEDLQSIETNQSTIISDHPLIEIITVPSSTIPLPPTTEVKDPILAI
jgi:hypothetical protein